MVLKVNMYVTNSFQMLDSIQFTTDSWVHKKKNSTLQIMLTMVHFRSQFTLFLWDSVYFLILYHILMCKMFCLVCVCVLTYHCF